MLDTNRYEVQRITWMRNGQTLKFIKWFVFILSSLRWVSTIENWDQQAYLTFFSGALSFFKGLSYIGTRLFHEMIWIFHLEVGTSQVRKKCHKSRHASSALSLSSYCTFIPSSDLASRLCFNPLILYNKDNPQKFRVDFFVLHNNSLGKYCIVQYNVYQGKSKNYENIGIPTEIQNFATTQMAVINTIIQAKHGKEPNGIWCLFMATWKVWQLCNETTQVKRIGWSKEEMNPQKSSPRGQFTWQNKQLLWVQWMDNKVVLLTSSPEVSGEANITRRYGLQNLELSCEKHIWRLTMIE